MRSSLFGNCKITSLYWNGALNSKVLRVLCGFKSAKIHSMQPIRAAAGLSTEAKMISPDNQHAPDQSTPTTLNALDIPPSCHLGPRVEHFLVPEEGLLTDFLTGALFLPRVCHA